MNKWILLQHDEVGQCCSEIGEKLEFGRLEDIDSNQFWFMLKVKELIRRGVYHQSFSQ